MMLALTPELVDMARAERAQGYATFAQAPEHIGLLGPIPFAWSTDDVSATGAIGDPRAATVERGREIVELSVAKIALALEEICRFEMPRPAGAQLMTSRPHHPLVTSVVGSYPQPGWLIDRGRLGERLPPRVRARELWRVPEEQLEEAQDDATRLAVRIWSAPASTSSATGRCGGRATRTGSRPRSTGSTSTTRESRSTARATRTRSRAWSAP